LLRAIAALASFSVAVLSARPASADASAAPEVAAPSSDVSPARKAAAVGVAIVPGALVHGAGHYVLGQPRTANRLLLAEGLGIGAIGLGGVTLAASGASRYLVAPAAGVTIAGFGLFAVSWLADIYGTAAPAGGFGVPRRFVPLVETELGYRAIYDPVFTHRHLLVMGIDARFGAFRVSPTAAFALDDAQARFRLAAAYRFFGPKPSPEPRARDGSFVDVEVAAVRNRYARERFSATGPEAFALGRLDLARIGPTLQGSFAEFGLGIGAQAIRYEDARDAGADWTTLLLGRIGFGVYVGRAPRESYARWGEVVLYYDHRHDNYAAGLKTGGLGSGVLGHFGLRGLAYVTDTWGIACEVQAGSAYVGGLSLLARYGGM
jgi:hypothetical protein